MKRTYLLCATLAALLWLIPGAAAAATFLCSSGDVSCLVNAINMANANGQADNTIRLDAGVYALTAADNDRLGSNGLPAITSTLAIVADVAGTEVTILRPEAAPRLRHLFVTGNGSLTLDGVSLAGGNASSGINDVGGAVYNDGGIVTIAHGVLSSNRALSAGAIYNDRGIVTLIDIVFRQNTGNGAGSVIVDTGGTVTITAGTFEDNGVNFATATIFSLNPSMLSISDSRFLRNGGSQAVGAIYLRGGPADILRTTFDSNVGQQAGAIQTGVGSRLTIRDSAFIRNYSAEQGTVDVEGGTVEITNTTLANNRGNLDALFGSALSNLAGRVIIVNSTFVATADVFGRRVITSAAGSATTTLRNSLVSLQHTSPLVRPCLDSASMTSLGHNIFDTELAACAVQLHPSDIWASDVVGALGDTGQPGGWYVPLRPGSAAIDAGDPAGCPATDQLGQPRNGICDIGAVEFGDDIQLVPSPSGTRVPPAPEIIDNDLSRWTIGPNGETLRNGVPTGAGYGSSYLWYRSVLYVLGGDNRWWRWTGNNWIPYGDTDPANDTMPDPFPIPSVSGTRVPPAPAIVDNNLYTWTLGPNGETLRDGIHTGGGYGSSYLWYQGTLWVLGGDNMWWSWVPGANRWRRELSTDPEGPSNPSITPSPSGTRLPPASTIIDAALRAWTFGPNGETLRDGVHVSLGVGSQYLYLQGVMYVLGTDGNWWWWNGGANWIFFGANDPADGSGVSQNPSPSGTRSPPASAIIDNEHASWTLGRGGETLRNGVHVGSGYGTTYLWYENVLYVAGLDGRWWRWLGTAWDPVGFDDPAGGGSSNPGPSPSGTRVPPAPGIVDDQGATWTFGPGGETLRNGSQAGGGGVGVMYLWYNTVLYVFGTDNNWWRWTGSGWVFFGPNDPSQ